MKVPEIIKSLKKLAAAPGGDDFIYDFLLAFGTPKATVTLLRAGDRNVAPKAKANAGAILLKNKIFFESIMAGESPGTVLSGIRNDNGVLRHKPRFLIITDFEKVSAHDTKRDVEIEFSFSELAEHYAFFLPLAGMEIAKQADEAGVDVKAASKMARLYDLLCENNAVETAEQRHRINLFLTRLLFCYFAEDTGIFNDTRIFSENQFSNTIKTYSADDASDLRGLLTDLFRMLNIPDDAEDRKLAPDYIRQFPYVNGKLFAGTLDDDYSAPKFGPKARRQLIELGGQLDWSEINPDIFGSMFQGVIDPEMRHDLGMHYTSVPNIMKVITPLFLEELYEELDKAKGNVKKLRDLHARLCRIRIFDPACGSGNFLIIAYRELRRLEMAIFKAIGEVENSGELPMPQIHVNQFFGIEISDFAAEVAVLAMWLAEHQMNVQFKATFGSAPIALPLREGAKVVCDNATRVDWEAVCPKEEGCEVFVLGNPPYSGSRYQSDEMKGDMLRVFEGYSGIKKLDYICCWIYKAAEYVSDISTRVGFVTTNSLTQGEQVGILWPIILEIGVELDFAHTSFRWKNNAKRNAGVTCVILGFSQRNDRQKRLISNGVVRFVDSINPYLSPGKTTLVSPRRVSLSDFPKMVAGNKAVDGGHLFLDSEERSVVRNSRFVRPAWGAKEFLQGSRRWCLWIKDGDLEEAKQDPFIVKRLDRVIASREASPDVGANNLARTPHRFREMLAAEKFSLLVPTVSSERRKYIPTGHLSSTEVVIAPNQVIYDPEPHILSIISSRMHMVWVRAVAGRLKTDYRYSSAICYNNFPFPEITDAKKSELAKLGEGMLHVRDQYPLKTIAELYDPDKMPDDLLAAHQAIDKAIERCYRKTPFTSDEQRLEYLFKLYEEMAAEGAAAS